MTMWPPTTAGLRACSRCRVGRHDRCNGPTDCGCSEPGHRQTDNAYMGMVDMTDNGTEISSDTMTTLPGQPVAYVDAVDAPGMVGFFLPEEIYEQLAGAAELQDRDPVMVLKRAVVHYLTCSRGRCAHVHDEVPKSATTATTSGEARGEAKGAGKGRKDSSDQDAGTNADEAPATT